MGDILLLSFITFIDIIILAAAYRKSWKFLFHISYITTQLAFLLWVVLRFKIPGEMFYYGETIVHFGIAETFASIFFLMFLSVLFFYNIKRNTLFTKPDHLLIVLNALSYFAFSYYFILEQYDGFLVKYAFIMAVFFTLLHFYTSRLMVNLHKSVLTVFKGLSTLFVITGLLIWGSGLL